MKTYHGITPYLLISIRFVPRVPDGTSLGQCYAERWTENCG